MTTIDQYGLWNNVLGKEIKGPEDLFISTQSALHQRSQVLIVSQKKVWHKFESHSLEMENEIIVYSKMAKRLFKSFRGKSSGETIVEEIGFPNAINIDESIKAFIFPPGHPVDGMAYSCSSLRIFTYHCQHFMIIYFNPK